MIDLSREMVGLLEDEAPWMLYLRRSSYFPCRLCTGKRLGPSVSCPECLGTGYVYRFERWRVYATNASDIVSHPNLTRTKDYGSLYIPADVFYMPPQMHPQIGDFIYEASFVGDRPVRLHMAWKLSHVFAFKADHGQLQYYYGAGRSISVGFNWHVLAARKTQGILTFDIGGKDLVG